MKLWSSRLFYNKVSLIIEKYLNISFLMLSSDLLFLIRHCILRRFSFSFSFKYNFNFADDKIKCWEYDCSIIYKKIVFEKLLKFLWGLISFTDFLSTEKITPRLMYYILYKYKLLLRSNFSNFFVKNNMQISFSRTSLSDDNIGVWSTIYNLFEAWITRF